MQKVLLFDADGVLTLPEEFFSQVYARSRGFAPEPFEEFFKTQWQPIVTGKKDLKEAIQENQDVWQWHDDIDALINLWCETEDLRNEEMLELVSIMRKTGHLCYLATEQEKYRGNYMRDVMFKDLFDGYFISSELGATKNNPEFFKIVIERLQKEVLGLLASDIIFFDDTPSKVEAAKECGIDARVFQSIDQVRELL